jgi:hypothetical protein
MPWTATLMVCAPIAGRLADRYGERTFLVGGLLLQSIGMGWITVVAGTGTGYLQVLPALVIGGVGLTMAMPAAQKAVVGAVRPREIGQASGAFMMLRILGGVFGVAVTVAVFAGVGDGTFRDPTSLPTGARPQTVALADFNGDGELDIATGNCCKVRHGVSLLLNRGDGGFAPPRDYAAGDPLDPTLGVYLDASDINGDHRPDLVYGSVRLNDGAGRFEPALAGVGGSIADLNGDGRPDQAYATLDERNGSWGVWVELANPRVCDAQPDRGKRLVIAERVLRLANCRVGTIRYAHSSRSWRGRVIAQKPAGGAVLRNGARVNLLVGLGPG